MVTESGTARRTLVVIDDRMMPRVAVRAMLEGSPGFKLVGEATNGEEGVRLCAQLQPDIVLIDVDMPGMDGAQTAHAISSSESPPVLLAWTVSDSSEDLIRMIRAGCAGYALKDSGPQELERALEAAFRGEMPVPRRLIPDIISRAVAPMERGNEPAPKLSGREMDVLKLAAKGLATKDIAVEIGISRRSVDSHLSSVYRKLDVASRGQAVHQALVRGLIGADDI
jgi:DNA-binding NarL/FixJ family response regulator